MAERVRDVVLGSMGALTYEPMKVRLRAFDGTRVVVDSDRAVIVWEPGRVVPSYAVPESDITAELTAVVEPAPEAPDHGAELMPGVRILPPGRFRVHTTPGEELAVTLGGERREGAAYRLADRDLAGYVVLDFTGFEQWREEDEPAIAHPHDPFKRIDVRRSDKHVRIESDGTLLADSHRPSLLLETMLPTRYYLPAEDVHFAELVPSESRTACAYKGFAAYWALPGPDGPVDICWTYRDPLNDALPVKDMVCFFDEMVDVTVDGVLRSRPRTPWSRPS